MAEKHIFFTKTPREANLLSRNSCKSFGVISGWETPMQTVQGMLHPFPPPPTLYETSDSVQRSQELHCSFLADAYASFVVTMIPLTWPALGVGELCGHAGRHWKKGTDSSDDFRMSVMGSHSPWGIIFEFIKLVLQSLGNIQDRHTVIICQL